VCLRYATIFFNPFLPLICLMLLFDYCFSVCSLVINKYKKNVFAYCRKYLHYFDIRFRMHKKFIWTKYKFIWCLQCFCTSEIGYISFLFTIHIFIIIYYTRDKFDNTNSSFKVNLLQYIVLTYQIKSSDLFFYKYHIKNPKWSWRNF